MTAEIPIESLVDHLPADECDALATAFICKFSQPENTNEEIDNAMDRFFALCEDSPEMLWDMILEVLARKPSRRIMDMLVVGPLSIFLEKRGEILFGLVETQAEEDPAFRALLANVYQESLSDEIWQRILALREE